MAAGKKGLIESGGACCIGLQEIIDRGHHPFEAAREREARAVADE